MRVRFGFRFSLDKRKKFILLVLFLSAGLLFSQFLQGMERIVASFFLASTSVSMLFFILYQDIKKTFFYPLFILPFFYPLALGLFYFLVPERFLTRILVTVFFAVTSYALFLTHNIYAVSSIRTIQLLRAAHAVSFFLTVVVFFILVNIIFTLHLMPYFLFAALFLVCFPLSLQILWGVTLENTISSQIILFSAALAFIIAQIGSILSFWPVIPTVAALFLAGSFYTFVGLSQHWLEKRLFKEILWEYIWVTFIAFLVLVFTTQWG